MFVNLVKKKSIYKIKRIFYYDKKFISLKTKLFYAKNRTMAYRFAALLKLYKSPHSKKKPMMF